MITVGESSGVIQYDHGGGITDAQIMLLIRVPASPGLWNIYDKLSHQIQREEA